MLGKHWMSEQYSGQDPSFDLILSYPILIMCNMSVTLVHHWQTGQMLQRKSDRIMTNSQSNLT